MNIARFEKVSKEQFISDSNDLLGINMPDYEAVTIPKRATVGSAGYDFVCPFDLTLKAGEMIKVPTGIRCFIESDYVLQIYPRSSLGFKYQICLANTVGIIDSDYYNAKNEGHIIVALVNRGNKDLDIKKGDRIVQGIFNQYFKADEEDVTDKRIGGLGSSNK